MFSTLLRTFDVALFKPLDNDSDNPDYCCELSRLGYAASVVPIGFFVRVPGEDTIYFDQPGAHKVHGEVVSWYYRSTSGDIAVLLND